ncbi:hypothetical protein [Curtobacterium flaccumfaciens]|uniref:hypothetical protein n=1 Tax=Curtobacterium flaccumfaciens TaxID=2035 RepID=UPI001BDE4608|nr:hypothetical protein [Curtobacterium flaccumfaciens]MBT1681891.1 hypothetical protein [Curtobacterium flaccumfaciens pv. flaccumfaciens]
MALVYAFIDSSGRRYGDPSASAPSMRFLYRPASGRFAGQPLVMHAATWDGHPSGTWLQAVEHGGCFATTLVDELLGMDPDPLRTGDPRAC